jgi:hypothetical protein
MSKTELTFFSDLDKSVRPFSEEYRERGKNRRLREHRWLPYGMWTCVDGREVLFNRSYRPIWQRRPGQCAEKAKHGEWVPWKKQQYLFSDYDAPWRSGAAAKTTRVRVDRALSDFLSGEPMTRTRWVKP